VRLKGFTLTSEWDRFGESRQQSLDFAEHEVHLSRGAWCRDVNDYHLGFSRKEYASGST